MFFLNSLSNCSDSILSGLSQTEPKILPFYLYSVDNNKLISAEATVFSTVWLRFVPNYTNYFNLQKKVFQDSQCISQAEQGRRGPEPWAARRGLQHNQNARAGARVGPGCEHKVSTHILLTRWSILGSVFPTINVCSEFWEREGFVRAKRYVKDKQTKISIDWAPDGAKHERIFADFIIDSTHFQTKVLAIDNWWRFFYPDKNQSLHVLLLPFGNGSEWEQLVRGSGRWNWGIDQKWK